MANVLCVLYDDPVDGYPPSYARDGVPKIEGYHDGQTAPTPEAIGFTPGELLGSVSGELGLREFLEAGGHTLTVTSDKDGPDSVFERELPNADVVISQPFWPAYLTAERIAKAPNLKLAADRRDRLRPRRPAGGDRARGDRRRGHLLEQHQRRRARRDDDPGAGPQLHPLLRLGHRGRLEHRRLRLPLLRPRGHAGRDRRRGPDRLGGAAAAEAVRGRPPLHRAPPPPGRGRGGTGRHLPPHRRVAGRSLRRGDDQRPAAPRDREPVRRRAAGEDETRRLPDQHRPRQDLRPRRDRRRLRERPARRVRRRRLVPAAAAARPSLALDAPPRHDPAHLRHEPLRPGALRGRDARDPRVLPRGAPDPRGVPDRRRRQAGRGRRALLQRGRRDRRLTRKPPSSRDSK